VHGTQGGVDYEEIVAAVCKYFCRGFTPSEIADRIRERYGIGMSREAPYKYLKYAASKNWLQFIAPREDHLSQQVHQHAPWLQAVEVVHTSVMGDVAYRAAVMVVELLRAYRRPPHPKDEVHVGFVGGYSMQLVAEHLAGLLRQQPIDGLPQTVVFHTLVAGFDVDTPLTDPNAFLTYFANPAIQQVQPDLNVRFIMLHAPAVIQPGHMPEVLALPGVKEAFQSAEQLDLIVTSAAVLTDEHSMLHRYYERNAPGTVELLKRDGCVGDILWWPLGRHGPLVLDPTQYPYRSLTVIELNRLPRYIRRGTQVLLALGPCSGCNKPRTDILDTILHLDDHLITHLVVDSRTAREAVPAKCEAE
jgi:hypothetical protein